MQALALDIGDARVGVACGSTRTGIAMPVCVLPAHEVFSHAPSFRRVVEDHEPDVLVVGRPITMQGEPGPQAQKLTEIGQQIAQRLGLEVEFVDERLTSSEAKRILREQGLNEKQMRGKVDSVAASLFLQVWLDVKKNDTMGIA